MSVVKTTKDPPENETDPLSTHQDVVPLSRTKIIVHKTSPLTTTTNNNNNNNIRPSASVKAIKWNISDPETVHEDQESPEDETRLSKLFHLQLYGTAANPDGEVRIPKGSRKKSTLQKQISKSLSWKDVTTSAILGSGSKEGEKSNDTLGSERERDVGDSFQQVSHVTTMNSNHNSHNINSSSNNLNNLNNSFRSSTNRKIEPVLNTRMKNLSSNFSFRHQDRDRDRIIEQKSYSCNARRIWSSSIYGALITLALIFVLFLIFNRPKSYQAYYEHVFLNDPEPGSNPKVALCLPIPFAESRLQEFRISPQLASFLLYSLSPFVPNPDILDNAKLLNELSGQYRSLVSRMSRRGLTNNHLPSKNNNNNNNNELFAKRGLRKFLRFLSHRCSELILECQIGSRQVITGTECCRSIFTEVRFTLNGLCFVADDFVLKASNIEFPNQSPGSTSRLSVTLDAKRVERTSLDPRVIPWRSLVPGAVNVAVVNDIAELSNRHIEKDVQVNAGEFVSIQMRKRGVDNSSPFSPIFGGCNPNVERNSELYGNTAHSQASCRADVIQMVAEKSVNCTMISLPRVGPTNLPICGPLEGLALMYVLREQSNLVAFNPDLLEQFDEKLSSECPTQCYFQYFDTKSTPSSLAAITSQYALSSWSSLLSSPSSFSSNSPQDVAVLEVTYRISTSIRVTRYQSGTDQLFHRMGSICGCGLTVFLVAVLAKRCRRKRSGNWFQTRRQSFHSVHV
ncbi:hypothetical protein TCAL_17192 [Tigriopus californicus]|uniref:Uncharacterized protein n=1 Tax=Tigriopus californicus TaxID=6832 RepID=A0A553N6M1_TIGCA|nr:hypothetical protein TCAL_17192 [Tigriopus californicus]